MSSRSLFLLVHGQHALGDEEAAEDVDRGKTRARKPKAFDSQLPLDTASAALTPTASSAPTTMTEEIALVTDISGVWSAGVTDQTT